jgi:hypothetical protein
VTHNRNHLRERKLAIQTHQFQTRILLLTNESRRALEPNLVLNTFSKAKIITDISSSSDSKVLENAMKNQSMPSPFIDRDL